MWIMHVPVISTHHLKFDTLNQDVSDNDFFGFHALVMHDGLLVYNSEDFSAGNQAGDAIPEDLQDVLQWAYDNDYEWVRFSDAGETVLGLPVYTEE